MIPKVGHYKIGETVTRRPFRAVRLWELDPAPVLETNQPRRLPWAVLLKSTDDQVREIASMLANEKDEEALGRFLIVGKVRYDRGTLRGMIGGTRMGLAEAILEAVRLAEEERAEARGRAEGEARGRTQEARRFLRLLLRKHLPELESMPQIDAITDLGVLESLFDKVFDGGSASAIRAAILQHAESPGR